MPACRLHELAKVLFQTREAEGAEHTRVPGMHTAEEALRELVKGHCQRRRFYAATGTSMKKFDVSSSMRVKFFFMADVFVCGIKVTFTSRDGAHAGIGVCGNWMFFAFWRKFLFEFTLSFFWEVLLETSSLSLDKNDSRMDLDINRLWSTANQSKL